MSDTITTTPVTPAGPPHRKHSRKFRVLRAVGIGFAGLVVIGAVSSAVGGPQAKPAAAVTAPRVTATPTVTATATVTATPTVTATAAPATTAPTAPATTPSVNYAMAAWCASDGYTDLQATETDTTTMGTDAENDDLLAVEADGSQLATDADTAISNPPPVTHAQQVNYVMAMGALAFAGSDAAAGDITSATTAITTATGYLNKDQGILSC
jgi:hypothetical protein